MNPPSQIKNSDKNLKNQAPSMPQYFQTQLFIFLNIITVQNLFAHMQRLSSFFKVVIMAIYEQIYQQRSGSYIAIFYPSQFNTTSPKHLTTNLAFSPAQKLLPKSMKNLSYPRDCFTSQHKQPILQKITPYRDSQCLERSGKPICSTVIRIQQIISHNIYIPTTVAKKKTMLGAMKCFAGVGGFLILAIGLAMLGVTIYGFINSELLFNEYAFLGILLAADLIIIFASVIGIIGIKRGSGPLICVFQIFVMIFCAVFLGMGIASEVLPKTMFEGNCTNSNNDLIALANEAYNISNGLCTGLCPCGLTDEAMNDSSYSAQDKARLALLTRSSSGPVRTQDCDLAKNYNQTVQNMFKILGAVEESLDCSNWCANSFDPIIYKFSSVNDGKPKDFCYDTMKTNLEKYGNIIGITAFAVSFFLLLVCLCNLCICCTPERRSMPMSKRFVYNDGGYYRSV